MSDTREWSDNPTVQLMTSGTVQRNQSSDTPREMECQPYAALPMKNVSEAEVRKRFTRFDADNSGALDFEEFCVLMNASRSAARVDAMPGVIYCGGVLVNPSQNVVLHATTYLETQFEGVILSGGKLMNPRRNPQVAREMAEEAVRAAERAALRPYEPWSILARAIAKPTAKPSVRHDLAAAAAAMDAEMRRRMKDDINGFQFSDDDDESITDDSSDDGGGFVEGAAIAAVQNMIRNNEATRQRGNPAGTSASSRSRNKFYNALKKESSAPRRLHAALLVLRFLAAALSPAYIHPDEYFQSTEVAAADVLGVSTTQPWEFTVSSPARSAIGPAISCGAPYWLLKVVLYADWLGGGGGQSHAGSGGGGGGGSEESGDEWRWRGDMTPPLAIVLAPRLFLFLLSLLLDASAARAARAVYWARRNKGRTGTGGDWAGAAGAGINAKIILASCWPVLTMQMRPFSNSLEALALGLAILVTLCNTSRGPFITAVALGVITAVGVWIRFTFVFFAIPLGLHVVLGGGGGGGGSGRRLSRGLVTAFGGVAAATVAALALVFVDTLYFRGGRAVAQGLAAGPGATTGAAAASLRAALLVGLALFTTLFCSQNTNQ
jgi:hypothetical protein